MTNHLFRAPEPHGVSSGHICTQHCARLCPCVRSCSRPAAGQMCRSRHTQLDSQPPPPLAPSFSRPSIPTLHSSLSGEVCFISRDLFLFVSAVCTVAQALCWVLGGNWPCRLVGRQAGKREFTAHCGQRCDGESAGPGQGPPKPLGHRRESEEVTPRLGPQG